MMRGNHITDNIRRDEVLDTFQDMLGTLEGMNDLAASHIFSIDASLQVILKSLRVFPKIMETARNGSRISDTKHFSK